MSGFFFGFHTKAYFSPQMSVNLVAALISGFSAVFWPSCIKGIVIIRILQQETPRRFASVSSVVPSDL